jgi:hypothetical protein
MHGLKLKLTKELDAKFEDKVEREEFAHVCDFPL